MNLADKRVFCEKHTCWLIQWLDSVLHACIFPGTDHSNSIISSEDFQYSLHKRIRNFWVILLNEPGKKFGLCLCPVKPINIVTICVRGCNGQKKKDTINNAKNLYILLWKWFWVYVWIKKKSDLQIYNISITMMGKDYKSITQKELERSLLAIFCFLLRFSTIHSISQLLKEH